MTDMKDLSPTYQTISSRYTVLTGAIIIQLILGTVYGYSIFWQPLQSAIFPEIITAENFAALNQDNISPDNYTIVANDQEFSKQQTIQRGRLKYTFSICILSFALVMVIAGRIQDIKGPRFTAIIGAVLMGSGFIVAGLSQYTIVFYLAHAAFMGVICLVFLMLYHAVFGELDKAQYPILHYVPMAISTIVIITGVLLGHHYVGANNAMDHLFMLWGTVGFLAGAGIGFAYVCPIAALIKWFPDKKGLVSGIAVAGFGFGAYLFKGKTMGALGFIEAHSMNQFFIIHGLICFIGILIGAMLIKNPPETVSPKTSSDSNWQHTLKQPSFYILWFMFFSGAMSGLMVIGIIKDFSGEQLVSAYQANQTLIDQATKSELIMKGAEAVGWLAIFNAVGRIIWGLISDKIGRTNAFISNYIFQACIMFFLATLNTEISLAVGASIVGFNFGGYFALFPSATADLFGAKNLGANYGWVFTSYGIAGVIGIVAGNLAKELTQSYSTAFMTAAILCLISAGFAKILPRFVPKKETDLSI